MKYYVAWVHVTIGKGKNYRELGAKTAIVQESDTAIQALVLLAPMRRIKIPLREKRRVVRELTTPGGRPYPLKKACRMFRASARQLDITKGGLQLLRAAEKFKP